jgi:adenylylsulfate kinase
MEKDKKYSLFIGRFQPYHRGHDHIVRQALNRGKSVCIAIRDTPITEWDPYTCAERREMIEEHYENEDVQVIVIPDIESVNVGRKVGYEVIKYDVPENIEGISATQIRQMMADGNEEWKTKVPKAVADFLISRENTEQSDGGVVLWFTGLSGAGKSTLANRLLGVLKSRDKNVKLLDGDEVRKNLTSDLGFSKVDRSENIKRIGYVAKTIADCNGIAMVAAISPYKEDREKAKKLIGEDRFFEIFMHCDIEILKKRDVKGLYAKAISGEIPNFTGISDPYECPHRPDCIINSGTEDIEDSINTLIEKINERFIGKI